MGEVLGIDVSHHNGQIDWKAVAKNDKKFAIMKAQYEASSHRIDETFEYNYSEAGKNGLSRGVYIYIARHSVADPIADVKALLNKLKGRPLEYGIWLDLEDSNIRYLGKDGIESLAKIYIQLLRSAGYYVGIYCNLDWYSNLISFNLKQNYDFWIARYPKQDKGIYNPNSSIKPNKFAVAWQYSSRGNVPGVRTRCDLNVDFDGVVNLMGGYTATWGQKKSNREIAQEVFEGKWGTKFSKPTRKEMLEAAGYNYYDIQAIVNQIAKSGNKV